VLSDAYIIIMRDHYYLHLPLSDYHLFPFPFVSFQRSIWFTQDLINWHQVFILLNMTSIIRKSNSPSLFGCRFVVDHATAVVVDQLRSCRLSIDSLQTCHVPCMHCCRLAVDRSHTLGLNIYSKSEVNCVDAVPYCRGVNAANLKAR